jgi:hypothetical protein
VTTPALFQINFNILAFDRRMGFENHRSELAIPVRLRCPMTLVTVASLFGRMPKTIYFPLADTMTDPAVVSEQPFMWIKMASFAS